MKLLKGNHDSFCWRNCLVGIALRGTGVSQDWGCFTSDRAYNGEETMNQDNSEIVQPGPLLKGEWKFGAEPTLVPVLEEELETCEIPQNLFLDKSLMER